MNDEKIIKEKFFYLGESSFDTVSSNDAPILRVCAPLFEELSGQTVLQHAWTRQHHARTHVFEMGHALKENKDY